MLLSSLQCSWAIASFSLKCISHSSSQMKTVSNSSNGMDSTFTFTPHSLQKIEEVSRSGTKWHYKKRFLLCILHRVRLLLFLYFPFYILAHTFLAVSQWHYADILLLRFLFSVKWFLIMFSHVSTFSELENCPVKTTGLKKKISEDLKIWWNQEPSKKQHIFSRYKTFSQRKC